MGRKNKKAATQGDGGGQRRKKGQREPGVQDEKDIKI